MYFERIMKWSSPYIFTKNTLTTLITPFNLANPFKFFLKTEIFQPKFCYTDFTFLLRKVSQMIKFALTWCSSWTSRFGSTWLVDQLEYSLDGMYNSQGIS